jgi:sigma-E factor negative regulatory protein RseA
MSDRQENLSAFVDGESQQFDIDLLQNDKELQAKWQNYHLLGDTLRGDAINVTNTSILDAIADALDDEPTILAPRRSKRKTVWDNVVSLSKQSSQFAVAAGVAAVMILGVQSYNTEQTQPFMTAPTSGPQGGLSPVSLSQSRTVENPNRQAVTEQRKRINALLADHKQQVRLQAVLDETKASKTISEGTPQ